MTYIKLNEQYAQQFIDQKLLSEITNKINDCHKKIHEKTGAGNNFLGWLDLPSRIDPTELKNIVDTGGKIREESDVVIIVGIGGSYLGSKAAIDFLQNHFFNLLTASERKAPQIIFAGQHLSSRYMTELESYLKNKSFSIIVISKSGTTTEPGIAFRFFRTILQKKYNNMANERIYAITDKAKGSLKTEATENNYTSFIIPDDVGGRYSVLTAVGLLPMVVAGISIEEVLDGAKRAETELTALDNPAYRYAALRNVLYNCGKTSEILVNYEPSLQSFGGWWQQLFGESEGKENKGILPLSANFTTDLHSLGQFIQEGTRNIFETVLYFSEAPPHTDEIVIKSEENNTDGLNYLGGKTVSYINQKALEGTVQAHVSGGVPNILLSVPKQDAFTFGYLVYFFEKACAMSGYLLEINPFDQPGVEAYKNSMFKLLEKPGY